MDFIAKKIDNYNLFTNIVPGYIMLMFNIYYFEILIPSILEQLVYAYIIGLTLNRIGSIITAKVLLLFTKEKGENYSKYIKACKQDDKIEVLLQQRNEFRTICTLFIVCIIEMAGHYIVNKLYIPTDIIMVLVLIILVVIYGISFCKHNKYIADRVRNGCKNQLKN